MQYKFGKLIATVLMLFLICALSFGQECKDYKWKRCDGFGPPFKYSGQSKAALFAKGQSSDFYIIAYEDFEYSVRICHDKKLKDVFFRIRKADINKQILYDSSTEEIDYLEKQFSSDKTQKLIIEVVVAEGDEDLADVELDDISGCVAVLIEYYRKKNTGF